MQEARDTVISKTCRASVYHQGAGMGEEMVKRIKPKESCRVQVTSLTVWEAVGRREQGGSGKEGAGRRECSRPAAGPSG